MLRPGSFGPKDLASLSRHTEKNELGGFFAQKAGSE